MADSFDYIESRADADELIDEFGQTVQMRKVTTSGPEWEPVESTEDFATKAAILDYNARQIDGENILLTDRRALVAAGPLAALGVTEISPSVDKLVVAGVPVPIVRVMPLNPAGVVVMFDCQLRF